MGAIIRVFPVCFKYLTAFHRHLAELLVMGVLVELHRAGQEQGQPEDSSCLFVFVIILKKTKIKKSKDWIASLALFNI